MSARRAYAEQTASAGTSTDSIIDAVLDAAKPKRNLSWLDLGCGTGDLLRRIRDYWDPTKLSGVDPIAWIAEDLTEVHFHQMAAEDVSGLPVADRVMLVETIEHLESPWAALRTAAGRVAPGGRIVVSTPNTATLRHRLDLAVRGQLTSFRPAHEPHLSPALPHVTARILAEEGLRVDAPTYAAADVIPLSQGRMWSARLRKRWPVLLSISVIVTASRPV
jgi:2-polyprenyl-3-methyl-5-hydroxy-6-metoxy-1,4-benzoquinol methylase